MVVHVLETVIKDDGQLFQRHFGFGHKHWISDEITF
jgi:hypothetical protein